MTGSAAGAHSVKDRVVRSAHSHRGRHEEGRARNDCSEHPLCDSGTRGPPRGCVPASQARNNPDTGFSRDREGIARGGCVERRGFVDDQVDTGPSKLRDGAGAYRLGA